jgi:hypothetical protein
MVRAVESFPSFSKPFLDPNGYRRKGHEHLKSQDDIQSKMLWG